MNQQLTMMAALVLLLGPAVADADAVAELLGNYQRQGADEFSTAAGSELWTRPLPSVDGGQPRACTTCHGSDLKVAGKHVRTGKVIEPMAPSVNRQRLTDVRKIEKWLKRNCRWTLGRECTPREKGDLLMFLSTQ